MEDEADATKEREKQREALDKQEKLLNISKRSKSRGAMSQKGDKDDMGNTDINLRDMKLDPERPGTAVIDPKRQLPPGSNRGLAATAGPSARGGGMGDTMGTV